MAAQNSVNYRSPAVLAPVAAGQRFDFCGFTSATR
jgi:hypothetical protein